MTGGARTGEAKEDDRTGPKEGGRPASPSGAGEARSGSSATRAVEGGPCRRLAHVGGNREGHAVEENVGGSERSEAGVEERGTDHRALSVNEARRARQRPKARDRGVVAAMEWRSVRKAPTAHVRSTLPEASAGVSAVVRTPGDGGERKPVTGEAGSGDAAEGGEPWDLSS